MDDEITGSAASDGARKRFLPSMKGALGRSRRPLLAILVVVLVFGLGYALFVRERLRQVQERHLRLLGNAADKLERVLDITRENGDNLVLDLASLPTFLRQNPYVDLENRADPAVLARSLSNPEGKAETVLVSDVPRLEVQIRGLVEQGREAEVRADGGTSRILGRLEATEATRLERPLAPEGVSPPAHHVDLVDIVERLEVDLPLDSSDLPLPAGALSRQQIDFDEPALLVVPPGSPSKRTVARRIFLLSPAASRPGRIDLSKGLEVQFEESRAERTRAVFSDDRLRIVGTQRALTTELELTDRQARDLAAVPRSARRIEARRSECGDWVFQDGRPLERIGTPLAAGQGWSRAEAWRDGRSLRIDGREPEIRLGYFQRVRIPETGLKVGSYCPPELRAADTVLPLSLEQQRRVELLLRELAAESPRRPSYADDLAGLELVLRAAADSGAPQLEVTARFGAEPIELSLPPSALEHLRSAPKATLSRLRTGSDREPATFVLTIYIYRTEEGLPGELVRVSILATERQKLLLRRISEAVGASFELASLRADGTGFHRLRASAPIPRGRLPLRVLDGKPFNPTGLPKLRGTLGTPTPAGWRIRLGGEKPEDPAAKKPKPVLTFSFDLQSVLASPRLDAAFTSYFLADEEGQILFQRRPAAVARVHGGRRVRHRSGIRVRALEPLRDGQAGAPEAGTGEEAEAVDATEPSAEPKLRLICQPARLQFEDGARVWRLCGQVDRRAAISEALGSTPYVTFGLLTVALLGGLSIPFLRFVLMARKERLRRGDILMLLAGTWLALVIVALIPAALHRHDVLESVLDGQLRRLADRVSSNLEEDLCASHELLDELDAMATAAFACDWLDARPDRIPQQVRLLDEHSSSRLGLYPARLSRQPPGPFTSVFWTDGNGRQIAKAAVGPENTPAVPVGHRTYFRAVEEGRPWTARLEWCGRSADGDEPWLFFDTFLSITTGERSAALSTPSSLPLASCGAPGTAAAVLTGLPPAVRAPVVSEPLGFAVIDAAGSTLFHSQPALAQTSNFLDDIGKPDELAAALVSRTPRSFDATYQSRPHAFYVRPLFPDGGLPGERPGWWIVTFFDKELPRTIVSEAVLQSLVPTLLTGLLLGLLLLLFRKRVLRDLWPTRGETDHYLFLGVIYMAAVLIQLAALLSPSVTAEPLLLAAIYTLLPLAVVSSSSLLLHRERKEAPDDEGGRDSEDPAAEPGFMARAGARIRRVVDRVAGWLQPGRRLAHRTWAGIEALGGKSVFSDRDSLAYVAGMILLWVLLAVLPTLGFFSSAWSRQLNVLLEFDALQTLEGLAARHDETRDYLARSDLDGSPVLETRLSDGKDLYLFSAAAELLDRQQRGDLLQRWLSTPTIGARAINTPIRWTDRALSDLLPIYNRATQSLRYLGSGRVRGFVLSGDTLQLTLPDGGGALPETAGDYVSVITSGTEPGVVQELWIPALLLLLLIVTLAVWVRYTANHICFSRVDMERGEELDEVVRAIRQQAALAWAETSAADAVRPVRGFIAVVTSRQQYETLQALGEARYLCETEESEAPSSRPEPWGLIRRSRAGSVEASTGERAIVICKRLENGIENPEVRKRKLAVLRELIKSPRELPVLLCPRDPQEVLRPAMPGGASDATTGGKSFALDEEEAAVWSAVLRQLELRHVALPKPDSRPDEPPREEDHWVIWSNCTTDERLAMVHLAAESLLNPKQADAVASLGRRGIVELAPTLRFTDPSFREFVGRFRKSPHFRRVEREARSAGWGSRRWILSTVVVVAAVLLFLTKPHLFSTTLALLGAIAAAVPAFLALLRASGGGAGPANG